MRLGKSMPIISSEKSRVAACMGMFYHLWRIMNGITALFTRKNSMQRRANPCKAMY